jgi:hypothetical protein
MFVALRPPEPATPLGCQRVCRVVMVACAVLAQGCFEALELEAQRIVQPAETLSLVDEQGAWVDTRLEVLTQVAAAEADLVLDWSALRHDLWGRPLEPTIDAQRVMLYHFRIDDLASVLDGLEDGSLPQSVVDLQVSCESEAARCAFSEFTFTAGHDIDVAGRFREGDGTWLVQVQRSDGQEAVAYLALEPDLDSTAVLIPVTDRSSTRRLEAELRSSPTIPLLGEALLLDWTALTTDCLGDPLLPGDLDELILARVPDLALDHPEELLLDLPAIAEELWIGDAGGYASFPTAQLVELESGEQGFAGPQGVGSWVLTLGCSACDDPLPRFVARLGE